MLWKKTKLSGTKAYKEHKQFRTMSMENADEIKNKVIITRFHGDAGSSIFNLLTFTGLLIEYIYIHLNLYKKWSCSHNYYKYQIQVLKVSEDGKWTADSLTFLKDTSILITCFQKWSSFVHLPYIGSLPRKMISSVWFVVFYPPHNRCSNKICWLIFFQQILIEDLLYARHEEIQCVGYALSLSLKPLDHNFQFDSITEMPQYF